MAHPSSLHREPRDPGRAWLTALLGLALTAGGCRPHDPQTVVPGVVLPSPIEAVDVSVPSRGEVLTDAVRLRTPRAAWTQLALRVMPTGTAGRPLLRLPAFARGPAVSAVNAYQLLSAPVDFDTAAYVRQSGETGGVHDVPRVLLPLAVGPDGTVDLTATRDPDHPTAPPSRRPHGPVLIWVEFRVAASAPAGDTAQSFDLLDGPGGGVLGSVPVTLSVADLSLPDTTHLRLAAPLDWSALAAAYPKAFAGVTPRLLARRDPAAAAAVAVLDAYVAAAHDGRVGVFVDRLQPIVKWPPGHAPTADWADYDGVVGPWLDGSAFADHRPAGYWPLPTPDALDGFDLAARSQYRALAAGHFEAAKWVPANVCPAVLRPDAAGPVTEAAAIILSAEARAALDAGPRLRALLPVGDDRLLLASAGDPSLVQPASTDRLLTRAAGGLTTDDPPAWPPDTLPPDHYLDLALAGPGATPGGTGTAVLHGTGDEQDVRSAAWLAFLRDATVVLCGPPLPSAASPAVPVRADELPWFYPGAWYGVDGPLPTLQVKWLRQAEQDYEVLTLAAAAGDRDAALAVCRLIAKPVDVGHAGSPAAATSEVSLLGGATDPHVCDGTRDLLVDRVVGRRAAGGAGGSVRASARAPVTAAASRLDLRTVRWFNAHQRPTAFATGVRWTWSAATADLLGQTSELADPGPGSWITARVAVDVYDPADAAAAAEAAPADGGAGLPAKWSGNTLQWQTGGGWEVKPPTTYLPVVPARTVRRATALARFNLDAARAAPPLPAGTDPADAVNPPPPATLCLVDGGDGQTVPCPLVLPVATCDRLARPVSLDGNLDDWTAAEAALLERPLVRMADRPAVQAGEARPAAGPTSLYTGWTEDDLYVAFRVTGVSVGGDRSARNFVQYRDGRAWGEDLTEVTIQPVYVDDSVGPTVHVVCKTGGEWVERQPAAGGDWEPFEGTALRYAASVVPANQVWRGELAIPWSVLATPGRGRPALLRFNFGQHVTATGESATWAGPVDRSRQTAMAGLLVLRDPAK